MNAVSVAQNAVDMHNALSGEISQLEPFVTSDGLQKSVKTIIYHPLVGFSVLK